MKKSAAAIMTVLCLALVCPAGQGEGYTVGELRQRTETAWQAVYETPAGRTEVAAPVRLPEGDRLPALRVRRMPQLEEEASLQWQKKCAEAAQRAPEREYAITSSAFVTGLTWGEKALWGEGNAFDFNRMGQDTRLLPTYDPDEAYAENNELTLGEAWTVAREGVQALFPGQEMWLRQAAVESRSYWKEDLTPISEKGSYLFCGGQAFHGVPLLASVHGTFTEKAVGAEDPLLAGRGLVRANVYGREAYNLTCWLYEETGEAAADVPVVPFETVKKQVEGLLQDGRVRGVTAAALGYVQYDTDVPGEMLLYPAWVVWCAYSSDGGATEETEPVNAGGWPMDNEKEHPLIFDGSDGRWIDPEDRTEGRCKRQETR